MVGPYSVSKTALLGLTKVLSGELGPQNIRVNAIAPGVIKTKFASVLTEDEAISEMMLTNTPLGRYN